MTAKKATLINAIVWAAMMLAVPIILTNNGIEVSNNVSSSLIALFVAGWLTNMQALRKLTGGACCGPVGTDGKTQGE